MDVTVDTIYKSIDFGSSDIELKIFSNINTTLTMDVTVNRNDIVSVESYPTTITSNEYNNRVISIPISSISAKVGQTILTVSINSNGETFIHRPRNLLQKITKLFF